MCWFWTRLRKPLPICQQWSSSTLRGGSSGCNLKLGLVPCCWHWLSSEDGRDRQTAGWTDRQTRKCSPIDCLITHKRLQQSFLPSSMTGQWPQTLVYHVLQCAGHVTWWHWLVTAHRRKWLCDNFVYVRGMCPILSYYTPCLLWKYYWLLLYKRGDPSSERRPLHLWLGNLSWSLAALWRQSRK